MKESEQKLQDEVSRLECTSQGVLHDQHLRSCIAEHHWDSLARGLVTGEGLRLAIGAVERKKMSPGNGTVRGGRLCLLCLGPSRCRGVPFCLHHWSKVCHSLKRRVHLPSAWNTLLQISLHGGPFQGFLWWSGSDLRFQADLVTAPTRLPSLCWFPCGLLSV